MAIELETHPQPRRMFSLATIAAIAIAGLGVALIVGSGIYLYDRTRSGSDIAEFTYRVPDESVQEYLGRSAESSARERVTPREGVEPVSLGVSSPDVARFASLYPGDQVNPKYWSEPEWAGSDAFGGPTIPDDYTPVLSTNVFQQFDATAGATRIRIPSINVDSPVAELGIIDLGDQRQYQTPDRTVGHIPKTATPGQQGDGWFFAHLESFVAQEGNIFRHLPEITDLIKEDPVDVYVATGDAEYVYRVTGTSQVHESDLRLTDSDDAQITLVTCWPPRVYDQRIVVDATLIAYKPL